ncbi:MAG TPA: ABC transporter substrate-binding protein [Xanthobacteraceae bacterium]|nr:ABC transporter substrate-binding protein [Xanthobacteraceae bacterium]
MGFRSAVVLAVLVCAGFGAPAYGQEKVRVSVPQRGLWDTGVAELGQRAGIFKRHGLELEILFTSGGAESQQAVIGGSMDIATGVGVSGAIGAYSKGAPLRLIGSEMIGAPDLFWYVPANSPLKTIADINGKTVGFSVTGSSSHAGLLEFVRQNNLDVKAISTGGMPATFTQTMTGQIDVGWASAPFGIDALEDGKIRLMARGFDVTALQGRTTRVNVTNLDMLAKRGGTLQRFMQAYRDTVDWMYSDDPAVLKHYADYSGFPEKVVKRVRDFIPKVSMAPDRIVGIDQIIADATRQKFILAPLSKEQVEEFVKIQARP